MGSRLCGISMKSGSAGDRQNIEHENYYLLRSIGVIFPEKNTILVFFIKS